MNVITTTILRNNLADSLREVSQKRDYLLVEKKGTITSAIVNIDLFEDLLAASNSAYVESIKQARQEYKKKKYFTHDQVFGDL